MRYKAKAYSFFSWHIYAHMYADVRLTCAGPIGCVHDDIFIANASK